MVSVKAFSRSGRLRVMVATAPSPSTSNRMDS